ncbi:MAG: hypothetical protein LBV67_00855 [Streptococcaceae bacterium]|nr:hypothetical protein [Streptococcaceae bacterium]
MFEKLYLDKKRIFLAFALLVIIFISWLMNKDLMNDPRNANIRSNLFENYVLPTFLLLSGVFVRDVKKFWRIILLIIGIVGFGYLSLHYLIGFHNPYWEILR